jgi:cell shape-determining protein MreC
MPINKRIDMKKLITVLLAMGTINAMACSITLTKKTEKAKGATIDGVNVSERLQKAISSQCSVKFKVMSEEERKALQIESLKKRLEKLQASN